MKKYKLIGVAVVSGLPLVVAVAPHRALAQPGLVYMFDSENDDQFNDPFNWDLDDNIPGVQDTAVHDRGVDPGNGRILMNAPSSFDNPWHVERFDAEGAWTRIDPGNLTFRQFCHFWTQDPDCGSQSPTSLNAQEGMSSSVLNGYRIRVGPNDQMLVGDPLEQGNPNPTASTSGFDFEVHGWNRGEPGWVAVTGTIGPGRWFVDNGQIRVGVEKASFDLDNPPIIGDGIIDSDLENSGAGNSNWLIDGLDLVAIQCRNLDTWVIRADHNHGTRIRALEYFEIGAMLFSGAFHNAM